MDDTKLYTIQVKGTAYKFRPLEREAMERLEIVSLMDASPKVLTKGVLALLAESMGDEQWDDFATRVMKGEVSIETDLTPLFDKLAKRMRKDAAMASSPDDGE